MELDYKALCSDKELKLARSFMNSKIDIFQDIDSYVFRNKEITQAFQNSYEHQQIQNDSAKILSSSSNLLLYTLGTNTNDLAKTKHDLKKTFTLTNEDINPLSINESENEYNKFKKKMMVKKLENDPDYNHLNQIINHPNFDQLMRSRLDVLKYVVTHRYLQYHPKGEEILKNYKIMHVLQQHTGNNEESDSYMDEEQN
jgi:hypothetical protein